MIMMMMSDRYIDGDDDYVWYIDGNFNDATDVWWIYRCWMLMLIMSYIHAHAHDNDKYDDVW